MLLLPSGEVRFAGPTLDPWASEAERAGGRTRPSYTCERSAK